MAKTAQEKAELKAEKLYEKTHKNIYRTSVGDQIFNVINYVVYTLFTIYMYLSILLSVYQYDQRQRSCYKRTDQFYSKRHSFWKFMQHF